MPREFTEDQVESFRKTFDLFDTSAKGYIGTKDIGKLIRSVGFCPSSKDIDNIIKQFRNSNDAITFDDFLMVISGLTCTVSRDALNDSINALDKDKTGKIDLNLFRQVLTSIGEPMDDISTSELFRYFGVNDDDTTIDAQKLYDLLSTISDGL